MNGIEVEDGTEKDEDGQVRLELSVLCTTGPHGERVPTTKGSKLSLKNHCEIQCGVFETILTISCCDVHYRDLNIGNVLFVVDPIPSNDKKGKSRQAAGKITGYLID